MGAVNMRLHRQVVEAVAGAHRYRCALQLELPFAVDAPEELHEILRSLRNQLDIIARHQEVPEGARVDRQRNGLPGGGGRPMDSHPTRMTFPFLHVFCPKSSIFNAKFLLST